MKKLVSILCAAAMLATAAIMPAAASAEDAANYTITEGYYYQRDNDTVPKDAMTVVTDTVDNNNQPVIKLDIISNARDFGINFDDVKDGTYRLTIKYYAPNELAQSKLVLRRPGWDGVPESLRKNNSYETVSRDIIISDNNNNDYQYARLRISTPNGTEGTCYIAEFKLQKIDDSVLGENLLPDLFEKTVEPTPEVKSLTMPALENSVTINADGSFNKAFVTREAFVIADYNTLVVDTKRDNEQKKYDLTNTITGGSNILLGVELQNIPKGYNPDNITLHLVHID